MTKAMEKERSNENQSRCQLIRTLLHIFVVGFVVVISISVTSSPIASITGHQLCDLTILVLP